MAKKTKTPVDPDRESGWLFDGKPFLVSEAKGFAGFVYLIIEKATGKKYIGRKYFKSLKRPKGQFRRVSEESDWIDYWSSSDEVKQLVSIYGKDAFERHIISLHTTRGDTNIAEIKAQFVYNVLEDELFLNESISGKYFRTSKKVLSGRKVAMVKL